MQCAALAKAHCNAGQESSVHAWEEREALADGWTGSIPTVGRVHSGSARSPLHLEILATLPSELDPGQAQEPGR